MNGKKYRSNFFKWNERRMEKIYLSISKIFRREEIYITFFKRFNVAEKLSLHIRRNERFVKRQKEGMK